MFWFSGLGFRVSVSVFLVSGAGFWIPGFGFRGPDSGFRMSSFGVLGGGGRDFADLAGHEAVLNAERHLPLLAWSIPSPRSESQR